MYPGSLIPKADYVNMIDVDCLRSVHNFYVIRRVPDLLENFYNKELDFCEPTAFVSTFGDQKTIELPGLSVNLLCKKCDENSTSFKLKGIGAAPWDGVTIIDGDLTEHYDPVPVFTNIYLPLAEMNDIIFDSIIQVQGDTINKLKNANKEFKIEKSNNGAENAIVKDQGSMEFIHSPAYLNYWHFELHCTLDSKIIKRKQNTTQRNTLALALDHHVCMLVIINLPEQKDIDPVECYQKAG